MPVTDEAALVVAGPRDGLGELARLQRRQIALQHAHVRGLGTDRRLGDRDRVVQRVGVARALGADPDIMLMDEPLGALDALTREHLQGELRRIWKETGRSVLLITHSVEEAVALGSRVVVMSPRPGRVVLDEDLPFAASDLRLDELRSSPDFVAAASRVRAAIDAGIHSDT